MLIAVLADAGTKNEMLEKGFHEEVEILWVDSVASLKMIEADCYFDLLFEMDPERNRKLSQITKPVFVGAVNNTITEIGNPRFIRINNWPGMIERELVELAFDERQRQVADDLMAGLGWKYELTPDVAGFISCRIIANIVNEAYFALGESVADKASIDHAMKAGTNYPMGPFEWASKIGHLKILALLKSMNVENSKYQPAPMLVNEIAASV